MKFKTKEVKGVTVIELAGNVMGGPDAVLLNDQLRMLINDNKTKIVIDLHEVQFVNSSGLGMLIGGLTTLRHAGGEMKITRASKKIQTLLEMTKLSKVMDIHTTLNSAVSAFK